MSQAKISPHRGVLTVAPPALAAALHLPDGTQITGAQWDFATGRLQVFVSHPALPQIPVGTPAMPVHVVITERVDVDSPDRVARTVTGQWA